MRRADRRDRSFAYSILAMVFCGSSIYLLGFRGGDASGAAIPADYRSNSCGCLFHIPLPQRPGIQSAVIVNYHLIIVSL